MRRRTFLGSAAAFTAVPAFAHAGGTPVIATGNFRDGDPVHRGSGMLSISGKPGRQFVVNMIDMEIVPGPNLFVYLVKEPDPLFPEDVTAGFTSLGKLQALTGTQNYSVPAGVNVRDWGSVVVWCDTFKTAFAIATIEFV